MKKDYVGILPKNLLVIIIIVSMVFSSFGMVYANDTQEEDQLVLSFSFEKPFVNEENNMLSVSLLDLPIINDVKQPRLPVKPLNILLPYGKAIDSITVTSESTILLDSDCDVEYGSRLIPVVSSENKYSDIPSSSTSLESSNQLWTGGSLQYFRGFPIVTIILHPVLYNQLQRALWFSPTLELTIQLKNDEPSPAFRGTSGDLEIVSEKINNPETVKSYYPYLHTIKESVDYLIITGEDFATSEVDNSFSDLIQHRINQGYTSMIATVEEITKNPLFYVNGSWGDNNDDNPYYTTGILSNLSRFNDTCAQIRNYIRYMHYTHGVNYVLLAGDADTEFASNNIVPVRGLFANESGLPLIGISETLAEEEDDLPSDIYYACLDGTFNDDMDEHFGESSDRNQRRGIEEADLEAEVYVGRAPVDSIKEMQNFVSKTISYEDRTTDDYYSQILFLGEELGFPGVSNWGGNYKDQVLPYVSDSCYVRTLYDRELSYHWSKEDLIEIFEEDTPHLVNHDGHGYYGYDLRMVNNDVDALENELPFFVYSHGCMAGGFDNPDGYDCIAEHFTVETPYAAFAVIMNSRYGLGSENTVDSPSNALDISFYKALFIEEIHELGAASIFSKEDNSWQIDVNGIRWVFYETNLFGDPLLSLHLPIENPPDVNLSIAIDHPVPGAFYLNDDLLFSLSFIQLPVMFGTASMTVTATSDPEGYVFGVEFYLNDQSIYYDSSPPYQCDLPDELQGKQEIMIKAYGPNQAMESINQTIFVWMR
jgi:hypothetical protein